MANLPAKALSHPCLARALKTLIIGTEGRSSYDSFSDMVWFLHAIAGRKGSLHGRVEIGRRSADWSARQYTRGVDDALRALARCAGVHEVRHFGKRPFAFHSSVNLPAVY